MRRYWAVGLALIVALTASAAIAAVAEAEGEFEAASYDSETTIQHNTTFGWWFVDIYCNKGHTFHKVTESESAISVAAEFEECEANETFPATIETNGCEEVFELSETLSEDHYSATMGISCPEGQKIVVVTETCEIQVGSQSGVQGVEYISNTEASPVQDLTMIANVEEIQYTVTKDGILCPLPGTGEYSNGQHVVEATVQGRDKEGELQDIWISD